MTATQGMYASAQAVSNTSGQGANAVVPAEIQGLNFGGLLLSWIWGIGNSTWIALLSFVPFIGWLVPFYLLFKGNELAWKNKQWDSVEHFKATQRKWAIAGAVVLVLALVIGILPALFAGASGGGN